MKKKINPNKIMIIFSVIIAVVVICITIFSSGVLMKKINVEISQFIVKNYENISKAYTQSIDNILKTYYASLNGFCSSLNLSGKKPEEIQEYIIKHKELNHPDFFNICYIDKDGTAYSQDGSILDFSNRDYFKKVMNEEYEYFTSSAIFSDLYQNYIFTITKKVYDSNGNPLGAMSAGIPLKTITSVFDSVKSESKSQFFIYDEEGKIISNLEKEILHTDKNTFDYKKLLTQNEILLLNNHICVYTYDKSSKSFLFINKIKNTDWTLNLIIPSNHIYKINKKQFKAQILVIIITILAILITLIIEFVMMKYFQKKQLLSTIFDPLTNLWTKNQFEIEASKLLKQGKNSKFMLVECDIRGFKFINQNFGEEEADKVLIYFAQVLKKYTLENKGIIGRGFADHFYILVKVNSIHNSMNVFRKTIEEINEEIKQSEIPFFPKFGISFLMTQKKSKNSTVQSLIGQASFAKSIIKDNILTQYSIYNSKLLDRINEERYIEQHMETALENKEFFVMYQPKIELLSDKIVGAEALVRWRNPKLGFMTPDKFIPLFERNGFIKKLDYYVYEQVFIFLQKRIDHKLPLVPISINMSRNHSKPEKFLRDFMNIFKKYSIPPKLIEIEIIERSVMDNNTLREITELLHKEGFSVAMDDFGSGESSLNMLAKIPVDVLKFDRTFLQSSLDENGNMDKDSADFIESLVDLSKHMKKQTVFEGVETKEQRDFLKSIECDQVQGYFYSKPLSEPDFVAFMNSKGIFEE